MHGLVTHNLKKMHIIVISVDDYKPCSYTKRDYFNFDERKIVNGISNLNMNFLHDSNTSLNSKFDVSFY